MVLRGFLASGTKPEAIEDCGRMKEKYGSVMSTTVVGGQLVTVYSLFVIRRNPWQSHSNEIYSVHLMNRDLCSNE